MALAESALPIRFLAYCRTSTDDQQSPADSKRWQLARCEQLTGPHGVIVEVVHDAGFSRSLPWARRPDAQALMERAAQPAHLRGFDAVVVAEPQRAWGDSGQMLDTLRKFQHYGVDLWVPELGGAVDLASSGHAIQLAVFGTMSEEERRRIGIRVRAGVEAHVRNGARFHVGAREPYGYRLELTDTPHPNPAKARDGVRLKRLVPDPPTDDVVRGIFERYADGAGRRAVVAWLNDSGIPTPLQHRAYRVDTGRPTSGQWAGTTVATILQNPTYTGYTVWARERPKDRLLDVENTTLGYRRTYSANPAELWVWSPEPTHDAIVSSELWEAANTRRKENAAVWYERRSRRAPHTSDVPYVLRGVVRCGQCGHWMEGAAQRGNIYLRCRLSAYAAQLPECADHPKVAYLREDRVVPPLLDTVARLLTDPDHAAKTVAAMARAARKRTGTDAIAAAAQRRLADATAKMGQLRKTLEAGGDPTLLGEWINEAATEMRAAEAQLAEVDAHDRPLTDAQVRQLVERVAPTFQTRLAKLGTDASPKLGQFLRDYGVRVDWTPGADRATVTIAPPDWKTSSSKGPRRPRPVPAARRATTGHDAVSPYNNSRSAPLVLTRDFKLRAAPRRGRRPVGRAS